MKVFLLVKIKDGFPIIPNLNRIKNIPNITNIIRVFSAYDLIVEIESERDDGVKSTIKKIRLMGSTKGTSTLVKHKGVP